MVISELQDNLFYHILKNRYESIEKEISVFLKYIFYFLCCKVELMRYLMLLCICKGYN